MVNVRHGPLVVDVHVQPLGPEVLGDHRTGLDDAARLREVALAEDLRMSVLVGIAGLVGPGSVAGWERWEEEKWKGNLVCAIVAI